MDGGQIFAYANVTLQDSEFGTMSISKNVKPYSIYKRIQDIPCPEQKLFHHQKVQLRYSQGYH